MDHQVQALADFVEKFTIYPKEQGLTKLSPPEPTSAKWNVYVEGASGIEHPGGGIYLQGIARRLLTLFCAVDDHVPYSLLQSNTNSSWCVVHADD